MTSLPTVTIYTDGGCNPNPGPGGWAAILLHPDQEPLELAGGEAKTTNNQMELQAAIKALAALPHTHQVTFYTDSQYLRRGITEWLPTWEAKDWQTTGKTAVKNKEQWQQLAQLKAQHQIEWRWTKGHAGNKWNERADQLASAQIPKPKLPLDETGVIHLFTGAAYSGKSKVGGWAVLLRYDGHIRTFHGQAAQTSANRMHIQSAVEGLRLIKRPVPIHLYTASDYLKDGATQWVRGWKANHWQTKGGTMVSHRDLWEALDTLCQTYDLKWYVVSKDEAVAEMTQVKRLASEASRLK